MVVVGSEIEIQNFTNLALESAGFDPALELMSPRVAFVFRFAVVSTRGPREGVTTKLVKAGDRESTRDTTIGEKLYCVGTPTLKLSKSARRRRDKSAVVRTKV